MRCPSCSKEMQKDTVKCAYCGFTLEANIKDKIEMIKMQNVLVKQTRRDWLTTLLLCIFLGLLGVHRFYTGNKRIAAAQLLTTGGLGIWVLIDLVLIITGSYRDGNGNPLIHENKN